MAIARRFPPLSLLLLLLPLLLFFLFQLSLAFVPPKVNYKSLTSGSRNYHSHTQRKKGIIQRSPLIIRASPNFLSSIITPLSNENVKKYFVFRYLSRICVSLSSAFSLNAKIHMYRQNSDNLLQTQVVIYNEILVKVLRVCWLYKLRSFVDSNIKLCRILSTVFYVIGIYLDLLSTLDFFKNSFFFLSTFYVLSSTLKSLSIMTYSSIRSATYLRLCEMLNNPNESVPSVRDNINRESRVEPTNDHLVTEEGSQIRTDGVKSKGDNEANPLGEDTHVPLLAAEQGDIPRVSSSNGTPNSERGNYCSSCATNSVNSVKKTYFIGEVSVLMDLLASLVDLLTVVLLARTTKYIKKKISFYFLLSSLHLFFCYKELQCLLK
ncbi:hypothetical protein C922_00938 [Plasmodium inui San Antonio 1]|uniref:Uncharacterized protein n=1 Tax=Plasmodium inui San Antonio 1 TaxID=1237626 RepID=W7AHQ5_9APIC|nr:hypothetical protein C922_00938 [Plasmodium inui San Antonio 1]EUD68539.1 hypothetical protein C922_00938 [Plasmodium inui San Antonio 1]